MTQFFDSKRSRDTLGIERWITSLEAGHWKNLVGGDFCLVSETNGADVDPNGFTMNQVIDTIYERIGIMLQNSDDDTVRYRRIKEYLPRKNLIKIIEGITKLFDNFFADYKGKKMNYDDTRFGFLLNKRLVDKSELVNCWGKINDGLHQLATMVDFVVTSICFYFMHANIGGGFSLRFKNPDTHDISYARLRYGSAKSFHASTYNFSMFLLHGEISLMYLYLFDLLNTFHSKFSDVKCADRIIHIVFNAFSDKGLMQEALKICSNNAKGAHKKFCVRKSAYKSHICNNNDEVVIVRGKQIHCFECTNLVSNADLKENVLWHLKPEIRTALDSFGPTCSFNVLTCYAGVQNDLLCFLSCVAIYTKLNQGDIDNTEMVDNLLNTIDRENISTSNFMFFLKKLGHTTNLKETKTLAKRMTDMSTQNLFTALLALLHVSGKSNCTYNLQNGTTELRRLNATLRRKKPYNTAAKKSDPIERTKANNRVHPSIRQKYEANHLRL